MVMDMAKTVLSYGIPFVDKVTMPARFARWLASLVDPPNRKMLNEPVADDAVTWDYHRHGWLPWMEFFYDWRFADVTGDGRIDLILTCGAFRQIAYRQDGSEIWRYEDPEASCLDIRMDSNFPVVDIDGDGIPELICARKVDGRLDLCIVDAQSGEVKRSIPYPDRDTMPKNPQGGHLRSSISVINALGTHRPSEILLGWDYRSVTLLDQELNILWNRQLGHHPGRRHRTMGHTPHCADIDGDGCEEIFAGSFLLDQDGSVLWVAPDLPALLSDGHADSVRISFLRKEPVILMSTGAYCFSAEGDLLWGRHELKHGQALRIGKIQNELPGKQVVVYEGASRVDPWLRDRILAMDSEGNLLWDFEVEQPNMQEGGFGFWLGDWNGDGLDEVFVNDRERVNILDGHGGLIDTLPGHLIYVFDVVRDGRAEALVLSGIEPGMRLEAITNDGPNTNPRTNNVIQRRLTTREMYNATRY